MNSILAVAGAALAKPRRASTSRFQCFVRGHLLYNVNMTAPVYLDVDPRSLRLPWSRRDGADPAKLARQISLYGNTTQGMPAPFVYRASDGELVISDGVTRATRVAKLLPGVSMRVELIGNFRGPGKSLPTVGDKLP